MLIALHFAGGRMSAGQIAALFGHAWPTTTRHLQALLAAGLVTQDRQGRSRVYTLNPARLALGRDWLAWFGKDPVTAETIIDNKDGGAGNATVQAQSGS
jgi:DNA-binding transcriptional ArsR family regulator